MKDHLQTGDLPGLALETKSATRLHNSRAAMLRLVCFFWAGAALVMADVLAGSDDPLPALVEVLRQSDDPQFQLDILKGMREGLKGRRDVKLPAGWDELAARLGKSPNSQVRELVEALSLTFGSASALASLQQTLMDPHVGKTARSNALASLLQVKDPALAASLQQLLHDPAMRTEALRGLAAYDDPKTPATILEVYPRLSDSERKDALNTLASRAAFARPLLVAVSEKRIPAAHLTADIIRQLGNLKDAAIAQQVKQLWGVVRESEGDKLKEIARYKSMIQAGPVGDASRGRTIFVRICHQCHILFGEGGKVGPDITGSNRGDLDYILQNVLDPNAVIPNEYRTSTLETKDERVVTGIVTRQDDTAITIVTANEVLLIPRQEVQSIRQG